MSLVQLTKLLHQNVAVSKQCHFVDKFNYGLKLMQMLIRDVNFKLYC